MVGHSLMCHWIGVGLEMPQGRKRQGQSTPARRRLARKYSGSESLATQKNVNG